MRIRGRLDRIPRAFVTVYFAGLALLLGLLLVISRPDIRRWTLTGGAVAVAIVGFSRLAIGVHYPSDLVAGWLWIALWGLVAQAWLDRLGP